MLHGNLMESSDKTSENIRSHKRYLLKYVFVRLLLRIQMIWDFYWNLQISFAKKKL